jgi:hypothetical protein
MVEQAERLELKQELELTERLARMVPLVLQRDLIFQLILGHNESP